jgi:hypothetical protein
LLKVRFPDGLAYVAGTGQLSVNDEQRDIAPKNNEAKDGKRYIVFFLSQGAFGADNSGTVTFQLVGKAAVDGGQLEVDPDVNDPTIRDNVEFDIKNPEFEAQSSTSISVAG